MLPVLHKAALAACDPDGQGFIQDPQSCRFDPASALCAAGETDGCLPAEAVEAARRIYAGAGRARGGSVFPGGMLPGSEPEWDRLFVPPPGGQALWLSPKAEALVRFVFLPEDPGPTLSMLDIDPADLDRRMAIVEPLYDGRDPDLSAFRAHGGKLIMFHGWDDAEVPARMSLDYYKRAAQQAGGVEAARSFMRLFLVPGMAHCRRGPGADAIDYLGALEAWVERGEAPDSMMAYHPVQPQNYSGLPPIRFPMAPETFAWSRPVFAWPRIATYAGTGDRMKPESWVEGSASD
jgi:feruloyl esterase